MQTAGLTAGRGGTRRRTRAFWLIQEASLLRLFAIISSWGFGGASWLGTPEPSSTCKTWPSETERRQNLLNAPIGSRSGVTVDDRIASAGCNRDPGGQLPRELRTGWTDNRCRPPGTDGRLAGVQRTHYQTTVARPQRVQSGSSQDAEGWMLADSSFSYIWGLPG